MVSILKIAEDSIVFKSNNIFFVFKQAKVVLLCNGWEVLDVITKMLEIIAR